MRKKHYSIKTEQTYLHLVRFYFRFHDMQHPSIPGPIDVRNLLDYLAIERKAAPGTQKDALNAISFMHRIVLNKEPGDFGDF